MNFLAAYRTANPGLFGSGFPSAFTLPDGTKPSVAMSFKTNQYYDGTATPSSLGALLTGSPATDAGGLIMPGDNSIQAKGALATAFANAGGVTVAAVVNRGNQQLYQFPLCMGSNAFMYYGAADSPQRAVCYSAALDSRLVFNPSNFTGQNFFASGFSTTTPKRTGQFNSQAGQQDDNAYNVNTPIYFGWWTVGAFPFLGRMETLAVYPKRLIASDLSLIYALAPFNVQTRRSLLFPNSGYVTLPAGALAIERTQPTSVWCNFAIEAPNSVNGTVIYTNVVNTPWCGFECWIQGSSSGRTAGRICVRIMHDLDGDAGAPSAIDLYGSVNVIDGAGYTVLITYDGTSLAAGVKIYVNGVQDTSITVAQNNLNASIVSNIGVMYIGNQNPGTQFGGALLDSIVFSNVVRDAAYAAAHASYDTKPSVDANTIYYADFASVTSSVLSDLSTNAYTGAVTGATVYA